MKSIILITIIVFGGALSSLGKPVNDIYSIKYPAFEDEIYVNDIPFDTYEIAVDAILDGDELKLEEEAYVDDIPFDTRKIACKCLLRRMIKGNEESYIDDIPFSTEKVLCEYFTDMLTEEYRNEENIKDIANHTEFIICSYNDGKPACVGIKIRADKKGSHFQKGKKTGREYSIIYPVEIDLPYIKTIYTDNEKELIIVPSTSL